MTVEATIRTALQALVSGRVFPDMAPAGTVAPYITYQAVGGVANNYLEQAVVGRRNARMQVNCWTTSRLATSALAGAVEDTLVVNASLQATVLGAAISIFDEELLLYGTLQDFSVWYVP